MNGPAVAGRGKRLAAAWFTVTTAEATERGHVRLAFSADAGASWGRPVELATTEPVGRPDVALLDDGSAVVAWFEEAGDLPLMSLRVRRVSPGGRAGVAREVGRVLPGRAAGFPRLARHGKGVVVLWTVPGETPRIASAIVSPR